MLIYPWPLAPSRTVYALHYNSWRIICALAALGIIIWLIRFGKRGKAVGALILLGAYIPSLIAVFMNFTFGDRYMYLPMVGLAILVASAASAIRKYAFVFPFLWVVVVSLKLPDWKDDFHLWSSIDRDYPSSYSKVSLAHIYYNFAQYETAATLYKEGFSDELPYLQGCDVYLATVLQTQGPQLVLSEADWLHEIGCQLDGKQAGLIAVSMAALGRWEEVREYTKTAPLDPSKRMEVVLGALALLDGDMVRFDELRKSWSSVDKYEKQVQSLLPINQYKITITRLPLP